MYLATVVKITNVRINSTGKFKTANACGYPVIIDLKHNEGDLGIYFPSGVQLSRTFCESANIDLIDSRIVAHEFEDEMSDGLWIPLDKFSTFEEGYKFDTINGVKICWKYISPATNAVITEYKSKSRDPRSHMFKRHFETEYFIDSLDLLKLGSTVIVTEKLHGISGRIGHVLSDNEWKYLSGTSTLTLPDDLSLTSNYKRGDGFSAAIGKVFIQKYHDPSIRYKVLDLVNGKLKKGETIFFEIIGFNEDGSPIHNSVDIKDAGRIKLIPQYGNSMTFSYGLKRGECNFYVYRITHTTIDGHSIDYSWNKMVERCKEIGINHVPHIETLKIDNIENAVDIIKELAQGCSTLTNTHIREGVVLRIDNEEDICKFLKLQSFDFKLLNDYNYGRNTVDPEDINK